MNEDKTPAAEPLEPIKRSLVGAIDVEMLHQRPEEVTKTKMRKFCFRRVEQSIGIIYLKNRAGQEFELEIDEATATKIANCFHEE